MSNFYSQEIKHKVRRLRSQGWSLGEISRKMKIPKNTLSGWIKDIQLTREQKERIGEKILTSAAIGRPLAAKLQHEKIEKWKQNIKKRTEKYEKLAWDNPEIGKLICGLLYLCEGSKYPSSKAMFFGNSDPEIIKSFLILLRRYFNIREEKLHCRIMPRWDQNIDELQSYWSDITKIPLERFYKTTPDKRTKGKPTAKKDYRGVCTISYCDTSLQFELQSIGETVINSLNSLT